MAEKLTKAERRELAREKARKLQEERERREKRNRMLIIGGVVVFVVLVGLAVWAIVSQSNRSLLSDVHRPADSSVHTLQGGISVGSSLEAGTANEGAVDVNIYLDYTCSYCNQLEEVNAEDLEAMASEGLITLSMHPVAILDSSGDFSGYTSLAANAAATVAQYAPDKFLDANAALFGIYSNAVAEAQATASQNLALPGVEGIQDVLREAGVPDDAVERVAEGEFAEWVAATTQQFYRDGYRGTPVVLVDGEQLTNEWQQPGALREMVTNAQ